MQPIIEIIQLSDGSWYLQFLFIDASGVTTMNKLIPFERYIYAREAAWMLKLEVTTVRSIYGELDQVV